MKDNLFEMLLNLFEKTLTQLKEDHLLISKQGDDFTRASLSDAARRSEIHIDLVKATDNYSTRVFTYDEQIKFTKASYQFLMRMTLWGIIVPEALELIINQMLYSESRFVTLEETKWIIRHTLVDLLDVKQLAFLDLVLYQREDGLSLH